LDIITFGEGKVLGGAYGVLTTGNQVYAESHSLIGNIRAATRMYNVDKAIGLNKHSENEHNLWAMEADPIFPQPATFKNRMLKIMRKDLSDYIEILEQKRGDKLIKERDPLGGKIFNGDEAKEVGLVDDTGTFYKV